jgi:hypothetical protein
MYYYDVNGTWVVNISGYDSNNREGFNSTQFAVAQSPVGNIEPTPAIQFSNLLIGYINQSATSNPTRVNNTGNIKLSIYLNSTNFVGQTDGYVIPVTNLYHNTTGSQQQVPDQLTSTKYDPTGGIPVYPNKISGETNPGMFILDYYMSIPGSATEQTYEAMYYFNTSYYSG